MSKAIWSKARAGTQASGLLVECSHPQPATPLLNKESRLVLQAEQANDCMVMVCEEPGASSASCRCLWHHPAWPRLPWKSRCLFCHATHTTMLDFIP